MIRINIWMVLEYLTNKLSLVLILEEVYEIYLSALQKYLNGILNRIVPSGVNLINLTEVEYDFLFLLFAVLFHCAKPKLWCLGSFFIWRFENDGVFVVDNLAEYSPF